MYGKKEVRAFSVDHRSHIELFLKDGKNSFGKVEFVECEEHMRVDSSINIDFAAGQRLMDDLWHAGIRPTEGTGSAGSLKATENHLADMQKIAFKMLDRDK